MTGNAEWIICEVQNARENVNCLRQIAPNGNTTSVKINSKMLYDGMTKWSKLEKIQNQVAAKYSRSCHSINVLLQ